MLDEPHSAAASAHRHVETCGRCQRRLADIGADAGVARTALGSGPAVVEPAAALLRVRNLVASARPGAAAHVQGPRRQRLSGASRAGIALAAASLLVVVAVVTGAAEGGIDLFRSPGQLQVVPVNPDDLKGFPDLNRFGDSDFKAPKPQTFDDAAAAAAAANLGVAHYDAKSIPAGVPAVAQFAAVPQTNGTFTFRAAKAAEYATQTGKSLPAMPPGMDGSTLYFQGGPAVVEVHGVQLKGAEVEAGTASSPPSNFIVIAKARPPVVSSTGVDVKTLEDYLASLPGVSPALANQIRSIQDPVHTLPIPVPTDKMRSEPVRGGVQNVSATYIGDNSLQVGGVIWLKNGFVYAVAGSYSRDQLVAIANSVDKNPGS
jgi:hypothetical protein